MSFRAGISIITVIVVVGVAAFGYFVDRHDSNHEIVEVEEKPTRLTQSEMEQLFNEMDIGELSQLQSIDLSEEILEMNVALTQMRLMWRVLRNSDEYQMLKQLLHKHPNSRELIELLDGFYNLGTEIRTDLLDDSPNAIK